MSFHLVSIITYKNEQHMNNCPSVKKRWQRPAEAASVFCFIFRLVCYTISCIYLRINAGSFRRPASTLPFLSTLCFSW